MQSIWCYDIEQFPNFHCITAINIDTLEKKQFVIHDLRDDRRHYLKWLREEPTLMIGFNNINYDYSYIDYILKNPYDFLSNSLEDVLATFKIINDESINRENSRSIHYKFVINQLDLYRIWHFDNKNRATSLKWVELALQYDNIQDLPFSPKRIITKKKQIKKILNYNLNDVDATLEFYKVTIGQTSIPIYKDTNRIELRELLGNIYNINLLNANDPKIGSDLILKLYCDKTNKRVRDVIDLRTYRPKIVTKDCIFPYIKFKSPEFEAIHDFFSKSIITDTKKVFADIRPTVKLNKYCSKHKDYFNHKTNTLKKLNVFYKGMQYVYGTGGIHGSLVGTFRSDDNYLIIDLDVTSLYPYIAIKNNLFPEHLGQQYLEVYEHDVVGRRVEAKGNISKAYKEGVKPSPIDKALTEGLKLGANGSYGKTNEETSYLYDPLYTMSVTINGQLLLSMLSEMLHEAIQDITALQINTDGITIRILRKDEQTALKVCSEWEKLTNLTLESAYYDLMAISNVNNYIAKTTSGKVKRKGWFEIDKEINKNPSARVVPIALDNYFINNIPVEETILNHTNIFDFCIGVKTKSSPKKGRSSYYHNYVDSNRYFVSKKIKSRVVRYYISSNGGTLIKQYSDNSRQFVDVGYLSTIYNKAFDKNDITRHNVNHMFYIKKANSIINEINAYSNQLVMFD